MSKEHIPFDKLSDFYDGNIITQREKAEILSHLEKCDLCRKEFDNLKKSLKMLACIKYLGITCQEEFVAATIEKIKQQKRHFFKGAISRNSVYAIAATILIFLTVMLFDNILKYNTYENIAQNTTEVREDEADTLEDETNILNNHKFKRIFPILISNNASIQKMTGSYIDGEISLYDYENLIKDLYYKDYNKINIRKRNVGLTEASYSADEVMPNYSGIRSLSRQGAIIKFRVDLRPAK